jgi:hypothetical protein
MRWGFVFVACPLPLSEARRLDLVRLAAQAWFQDAREIAFQWDDCDGVVRAGSDVVALGAFTGQQFVAEVNTPERSAAVHFLVAEHHLRPGGVVPEA